MEYIKYGVLFAFYMVVYGFLHDFILIFKYDCIKDQIFQVASHTIVRSQSVISRRQGGNIQK